MNYIGKWVFDSIGTHDDSKRVFWATTDVKNLWLLGGNKSEKNNSNYNGDYYDIFYGSL